MEPANEVLLNEILDQVSAIKNEFIQSSKRFITTEPGLYLLDYFASAVNNRAISLSNGFVVLAKDNNYLTAVSLIRLQLDNALRFFASTLVEDSNSFVMHFLEGKAIRDYKDIHGKKLTDAYLVEQLEVHFSGIREAYEELCGYVHLSDQHFFPTICNVDRNNMTVGVRIGSYDNFKLKDKILISKNMLEVSNLVIILVEQWVNEKRRMGDIIKSSVEEKS